MEICSLQSQTLSSIPGPLSRNGLIVKSFGSCQILKFPSSKKFSHPRKLKLPDFKAQASGNATAFLNQHLLDSLNYDTYLFVSFLEWTN